MANKLTAFVKGTSNHITLDSDPENMSDKYSKFLKFDGNPYRWVGDCKGLRSYFDKVLNIKGRWSSPGRDIN